MLMTLRSLLRAGRRLLLVLLAAFAVLRPDLITRLGYRALGLSGLLVGLHIRSAVDTFSEHGSII